MFINEILITTSTFQLDGNPFISTLALKKINVLTNSFRRRLTEEEMIGLASEKIVGILAGLEPLNAKVLAHFPSLKVISRCGVGVDNVDLDYAKQNNILVCNTPFAPTQSVAELTVGLMINLLRGINRAENKLRLGEWKPVLGRLLFGKTVGIVGYGNIGKAVSGLLRAFGCSILVYDPFTHNIEFPLVTLDELAQQADIITLHLPLTSHTRYLIDANFLKKLKPSAVIINTSRGGIVDEAALLQAIYENKIAGAALDVFEQEPYTGPLIESDRLILTPHMSSYSEEGRRQQELDAAKNLVEGLAI